MLLPAAPHSALRCRRVAYAGAERASLREQDEEDEREASLEKEKFETVKAKVIVLLCPGARARASRVDISTCMTS